MKLGNMFLGFGYCKTQRYRLVVMVARVPNFSVVVFVERGFAGGPWGDVSNGPLLG